MVPANKDSRAYNMRQKALVEALISNTDWREIAPALSRHLDSVAMLEIARSLIRTVASDIKANKKKRDVAQGEGEEWDA